MVLGDCRCWDIWKTKNIKKIFDYEVKSKKYLKKISETKLFYTKKILKVQKPIISSGGLRMTKKFDY